VSFPQVEHFAAYDLLGVVPKSMLTGTTLSVLDFAGFRFARHVSQRLGALKRPMDANCCCSFMPKVKTVPQSWQVTCLSA